MNFKQTIDIINKNLNKKTKWMDDMTNKKSEMLSLDKIKFDPSPNKSKRNRAVNCIVLHHTGPGTFNGIVSWLKDKKSSASAHYVVGTKKSELKQLVKLSDKAWHAGKSKTTIGGKELDNLNENSIGVEICNPGLLEKGIDGKFYYEVGRNLKEWEGEVDHGQIIYPDGRKLEGYYVPYPEEQIENLVLLCRALVEKYPDIKKENILAHYHIALPFGRKNDPFGLDISNVIEKIF